MGDWTDERRREAYRNAASNLLAFGYEADDPERHRVQSPTSGAWHPCDCSRGSDHLGELVHAQADPMPEWRRRMADRPPMADHWRRRHHCTDAVLGQRSAPDPEPVQRHVAPEGADWTTHDVDQFCQGHIEAAERGDGLFGGWIEPGQPATMP